MKLKLKVAISVVLALMLVAAFWILIRHNSFDVLQPAGVVADEQRQLIIFASLLSAIVVVPVFVMTFFIVWRYRDSNPKAGTYSPGLYGSKLAETVWWGVPLILITILGVVIWQSSHSLDPYKQLSGNKAPLRVQVIALQWKWLFVYPEQNIASVNFLHIPTDRPINFEITADAPMNSFWIPKLGGQVYAMSGMTTRLHLQAHTPGDYQGKTANISGEGYSGMKFTTRVGSENDFTAWVQEAKRSPLSLTTTGYDELAKASQNIAPIIYASRPADLYDTVVMKYMTSDHGHAPGHENMDHHHE